MSLRTVVLACACTVGLAGPTAASASPSFAPASTATIHPGVQTFTAGAQCTANFVYSDAAGDVFLGQAAHCAGTGSSTQTDGCTSPSLPLGTPVDIGGSQPGTLVYSSWLTMQSGGEKDPDTCAYNDLALVKVAAADVGKVNPTVPFWGGPTGLASAAPATGDTVLSYGNSELRAGITALSPKQGVLLQNAGGGWSHEVYTITPGIPGDSGSAFLDAGGHALGVLSTLGLAPFPGENGVGDLPRELAYASAHGPFGAVTLENGTEPFKGPLPGALTGSTATALERLG
jgi:hypothetical protein